MITFQLDQCLNNRRLAKDCNDEGRVSVWRFPAELASRPTGDPEMLRRFLAVDRPLLTSDGRLPWEHTAHIPETHPGIVIIRSNAKHTLRIEDVRRILSGFKEKLEGWHLLTLRNSVVELWPDAIDVYHIVGNKLLLDVHLSLATLEWKSELITQLAANAAQT